ncbi:MAG: hypothetical protein JWP01_908 [Myxococcales bacterium]|nr:hypothetical protein [Myxococcales bacterium]
MRVAILLITVVAAACGGSNNPGQSVCDNVVPAPAACMTMCDPAPGAPNTCPGGYHCTGDGQCDALCTQGGEECGDGYRCTPEGRCIGEDECDGLECNIVKCDAMGMAPTTITGTVFAPNGTLPLYGANVYVPNRPLPPQTEGAVCDRCTDTLPGYPLSKVQTDEAGKFTLSDVPAGANIPLVISIGKWRRQITIPNVAQCADTALTPTETRLPKNKSEGDMPQIAITTGAADSLECLVRKLGIDDTEINKDGSTGRIHLYEGNGVGQFKSGYAGGSGQIPSATPFWQDVPKLKSYDIVILSCEGGQNPDTKPQAALDAMKSYADFGGRVFMSHWHNIWIEGSTEGGGNQAPAVWPQIATWNNSGTTFTTPSDQIDEVNNPKGGAFATWMLNVMGSPAGMRGVVPIQNSTGKQTATGVDNTKAERWVYWPMGGQEYPQMFQFTTPNEAPPVARCGKVVFSDMHVSGGPMQGDYPDSCGGGTTLSPQEKALAFMFFDIASCVAGPIF